MSIQKNTKHRAIEKIKSFLGIFQQIWQRSFNKEKLKVFFRYSTFRTHPSFASYYQSPPVAWSNFYNAHLLHWINYPKFIDGRPFIVEVNDHPLSAVGWKINAYEPGVILDSIGIAADVYRSKSCEKILIPCDGFRSLFEFYFSKDVCEKLIQVPQAVCNLREMGWGGQKNNLSIVFCCLASDYFLKGVDLVLDAWLSMENRHQSKLILACPNIPIDVELKIKNEDNIEIIKKAPLTFKEKEAIFRMAHVNLAPTHVHGGANIAEGLEYGCVPLMLEYHSKSFQDFGPTISMPYSFYSVDSYGKKWRTFEEYFAQLSVDKMRGIFDSVVLEMIGKMSSFIGNPQLVYDVAMENRLLCPIYFSSSTRNNKLLKIYREILKIEDGSA